jgi:excinuclease ABC subunit A
VKDQIVVRGARQHNLKGVDITIPRRRVSVITGPSGSGKSSLAFDTIYAEGQRRYVESLSAYARQFLERVEKPKVDSIEGLSPAVAIQQSNPTKTSRSTVGTATEVYDYLRLLWARVGKTFCPECGREIARDTVESATNALLSLEDGTRLTITFPIGDGGEFTAPLLAANLRAQGFMRILAGNGQQHVDEMISGTALPSGELLVVADRLPAHPAERTRMAEAVATAFREGSGLCVVQLEDVPEAGAVARQPTRLRFSERLECPYDGTRLPDPVPQLFSFNNPRGACGTCNGFGASLEYDIKLIVRDPALTLSAGALDPWTKPRYGNKRRALARFASAHGIDMNQPWLHLPADQQQLLLEARARGYKGMFPFLRDLEAKKYKQYIRVFLRQYQTAQTCASCNGARLNPGALAVRVDGNTIAEAVSLSISSLRMWIDELRLSGTEARLSRHILREARSRVGFLCDVGLGYLTLDRATRTLSGGEAQRIALANAIGSQLVDALYVLDEPSIGLHPRDLDRLLSILHRLRDAGNTVLVVEHDLSAIRAADYMIELGPGSGEKGGTVVFEGPVARASESPLTGKYLTGERVVPVPAKRRRGSGAVLELRGARENNLRGVDARVPLGTVTAVTGVSGSGKSTLVHDVLFRALELRLHGEHTAREHLGERVGTFDSLRGTEGIEAVVLVDQSPIGRSGRSNPITYVKAFDEIRRIFAADPLSRKRKYSAGTFSFNVAGGRCERCEGAGQLQVEMVFLADVFVRCEECGGRRFKPQVLEVRVRGRNIADVLGMTVDEAIRFFARDERLGQALWQLQQVGLGYLRLGQPATTLSGGEAQRIKIARELTRGARREGSKLYVLDEPSTGLHIEEVHKLSQVFDRLVLRGNTVLFIEHNLDLIKMADWVIDLGPEGGSGGGAIVAMGTPEQVAGVEGSHTGQWLRTVLPEWSESLQRPAKVAEVGVAWKMNAAEAVEGPTLVDRAVGGV